MLHLLLSCFLAFFLLLTLSSDLSSSLEDCNCGQVSKGSSKKSDVNDDGNTAIEAKSRIVGGYEPQRREGGSCVELNVGINAVEFSLLVMQANFGAY